MISDKLAAEFGIDAWDERKRKEAIILLQNLEGDLLDHPKYQAAIIRDTREALAALRDTKDVWL
jgi:hypothetical protein